MIEVELPDGTIAEFPEGTSPAAMESALAKYKASPQALPKQGEQYSPVGDKWADVPENMAAGAGRAVDKVLDGLTDAYLRYRGEDRAAQGLKENVAEKRRLDAPLADSTSGKVGEIVGDVAMTAVPAGKALGATATALRGASRFKRGLAALGAAGGVNAAYEGTKIPEGEATRGDNAAVGGAMGAAGQVAGGVLARGVRGAIAKSAAARRLPQEVQDASTLGQLADRDTLSGRFASRAEEQIRSIPLVGDFITNARKRGTDAWRDDVLRGVAPDAANLPQGGSTRETVEAIQNQFGDEYRAALDGVRINPSSAFTTRLQRITNDPTSGLTPQQQQAARELVEDYYNHTFQLSPRGAANPPGASTAGPVTMSAEQAKRFEAWLSARARGHRLANQPDSQAQANMYETIEGAWESAYRSQLPLATRQRLAPTDARYSRFKTAERAATAVGNEEGAFTPSQLLNAVKSRSTKPRFAAGRGQLQEAADAGKTVFQDKIPDSGTAGRLLNLGALGGAVMDPTGTGQVLGLTALGSIPMMTSKTGKAVAFGETRAQRLLQRLRADRALDNSGVAAAQTIDDLLED